MIIIFIAVENLKQKNMRQVRTICNFKIIEMKSFVFENHFIDNLNLVKVVLCQFDKYHSKVIILFSKILCLIRLKLQYTFTLTQRRSNTSKMFSECSYRFEIFISSSSIYFIRT